MKRFTAPTSALAELPAFSGCSRRQLRQLEAVMCEVRVTAGTVLATQDHRVAQYVVIVDGTAAEMRDGHCVGTVERGDDIGGVALVDNQPHLTTIRACTPMVLQVTGPREFRAAYEMVPALRSHIDDESASATRRRNRVDAQWLKVPHEAAAFGYTLVS